MNNWIKPTDLPNDFWSECFVSVYDELGIFTELNYVKRVNNVSFWYSSTEQEWFRFRDDIQARVMEVEYPKITEEDFK
jgi:Fe2+ or Zn2+ uptake regulation protein